MTENNLGNQISYDIVDGVFVPLEENELEELSVVESELYTLNTLGNIIQYDIKNGIELPESSEEEEGVSGEELIVLPET